MLKEWKGLGAGWMVVTEIRHSLQWKLWRRKESSSSLKCAALMPCKGCWVSVICPRKIQILMQSIYERWAAADVGECDEFVVELSSCMIVVERWVCKSLGMLGSCFWSCMHYCLTRLCGHTSRVHICYTMRKEFGGFGVLHVREVPHLVNGKGFTDCNNVMTFVTGERLDVHVALQSAWCIGCRPREQNPTNVGLSTV